MSEPFGRLVVAFSIFALMIVANVSAPADESRAEPKTEISFWEFSGHAAGVVRDLVGEFNRTIGEKEGIEVMLTNHGRNFLHSFEMAMDKNDLPDIFPNREPFVRELIASDRLQAIDELPGGKAFLSSYDPSQLQPDIHTKNGHVFAVPRTVVTFKLIYNRTLFKQAGIVDRNGEPVPPKTWEAFRDAAKRISEIDPGKTFGVIFPMKGSSQGEYGFFWEYKVIRPTSSSFGKLYFDPKTGTYDFTFYKPLLELICAIRDDGSVFPGEKVISDDSARIRFGQKGNIGMYIAASWDVGVLTEQYPATVDWAVADIPLLNPFKRYKTISIVDYGYAMSRAAAEKHPEKILTVYRYINGLYWQKRHFEEGMFHPSLPQVYNIAKKPKVRGWEGFSDRNVTSIPSPDHVIKIKGPKWYQVFQMIYDGRMKIDPALERLTRSYNEALKRAVQAGDVNLSDYGVPR